LYSPRPLVLTFACERAGTLREAIMVVLNRIYTRTGDDGTTALGTGERRKKYDLRVAAYGTLDEANAALGIARLHTGSDAALDAALARIQNDLFDLGADLTMPGQGPGKGPGRESGKGKGRGGERLTATDNQVNWLESEIDRLNAELAPLRSFVLPGGSAAAAYLHLARTICRRGERLVVELNDQPGESVTPAVLKYLNRLSDFLFVASRYANDKGARDVLWVPGRNR
jgi:cob(I)alamin adenosyltransferase